MTLPVIAQAAVTALWFEDMRSLLVSALFLGGYCDFEDGMGNDFEATLGSF